MNLIAGKNIDTTETEGLLKISFPINCDGVILYFEYYKGTETSYNISFLIDNKEISETNKFYMLETDSTYTMIKATRKLTTSGFSFIALPLPTSAQDLYLEVTVTAPSVDPGTLTISAFKNYALH
jgi:hypothetical protein